MANNKKGHKCGPDDSNETIKARVLLMLQRNEQPVQRKDVVRYVLRMQNRPDWKTAEVSQGYYSTNFNVWAGQGIIKRSKEGYSITADGKLFLKDRTKFKLKKLREENKRIRHGYNTVISELNAHRFEKRVTVRTNTTVLNKFIEDLAKACNTSKALYADMVWQDELFEFQAGVIEALYKAYKGGLFNQSHLLNFEYVFETKPRDTKSND